MDRHRVTAIAIERRPRNSGHEISGPWRLLIIFCSLVTTPACNDPNHEPNQSNQGTKALAVSPPSDSGIFQPSHHSPKSPYPIKPDKQEVSLKPKAPSTGHVQDWTNRIPPNQRSLDDMGRELIAWLRRPSNDPSLLDPFFFPKEPFLRLKQARSPGGYWHYLRRRFHRDALALKHNRQWQDAQFLSWNTSSPIWVAPGREHNHIGYHRLRRARLRYRRQGRILSVTIDTMITWQGTWYVIHLLPQASK